MKLIFNRRIFTAMIVLCCFFSLHAQDRFEKIETKLKELEKETPGLTAKIELSVNGTSIQEFVRGIALQNNVNVSIDPSINTKVINNFTNVTVSDVFLFLCKKYDLDINFIGSIISFVPYTPPPIPQIKYASKQIKITYDKITDVITLDLNSDSLSIAAKEITKATGKNVVFAPDLSGKMVSGYIQSMPFSNALDKMAFANGLKVTSTADNFFILEKRDKDMLASTLPMKPGATPPAAGLTLTIESGKLITANAVNTPIADLLGSVSKELGNEYYLFTEPKGTASLNVTGVTFDNFLKHLFNSTEYTFKKEGDLYLIGDRDIEGLRATKVVSLQYRTVDKITEIIPSEMKKGVDIKIFPDLNSLILSGSQPAMDEIESFLRDIDRVVPVVMIEVIIADVSKSHTVATGIEAGLGKAPKQTGGTVFPGVDLTLSSNSLNEIIEGINGLGSVNLGSVTPNFYLAIKALETQGFLKIRSTPKLATLNGHEAKMSIGKQEYYLEQQNNVITNQSTQNIITNTYKSVSADLSVTINPIVSGDDQITMDILVKQSSFTARISPSAPPGTITRDFKSLIRVKNGEMIMLGGLEENTMNDSGSGVPFLSRIPVIKWFFSSRTKIKSKNKLTIFIKPTVIY